MNIVTSPALVYFELLANRSKAPSALLLSLSSDSADGLHTLAQSEDFRSLSGRFPCFLLESAELTEKAAEAAEEAGCKLIPQTAVSWTDSLAELPLSTEWIAGDWYMVPPAKPIGAQAASRTLALQLVQLVATDADTHQIEALLRRDPTLSYHLLRLVNSLGAGVSRQITSFSQAILILGRAQLRRWLNLMVFLSRQADERSPMLVGRVAVRARMMELLAKSCDMDREGQESAFMAGMFSLLGVLFGMPLAEILCPLKISDALSAALLKYEGDLGRLLKMAECIEQRDTAQLSAFLDTFRMTHAEFEALNVQAHIWMADVIRDCGGANV